MRVWTTIVAALLVLGLAGAAEAKAKAAKPAKAKAHKKGAAAKKHDAVSGKIKSVAPDGKSFVLKTKGKTGGTVTETLADSTRILVKTARHAKAQPGAVTDLKAGKHVKVTPAAGTPTRVVIRQWAKTHKAAAVHRRGKGPKKAKATA